MKAFIALTVYLAIFYNFLYNMIESFGYKLDKYYTHLIIQKKDTQK